MLVWVRFGEMFWYPWIFRWCCTATAGKNGPDRWPSRIWVHPPVSIPIQIASLAVPILILEKMERHWHYGNPMFSGAFLSALKNSTWKRRVARSYVYERVASLAVCLRYASDGSAYERKKWEQWMFLTLVCQPTCQRNCQVKCHWFWDSAMICPSSYPWVLPAVYPGRKLCLMIHPGYCP